MTIMIVRTARPTQELGTYCNPFPRIATPPRPQNNVVEGFRGWFLLGGMMGLWTGSGERLPREEGGRRSIEPYSL